MHASERMATIKDKKKLRDKKKINQFVYVASWPLLYPEGHQFVWSLLRKKLKTALENNNEEV